MSSKFLKIGGDYKISTESGGIITLDTGNEVGQVVITGDLVVEGESTVVETTNMTIEDNIILLNQGETGNGITRGGQAGLEIENGIVVDDLGRTSVADIYAAGDCTYHPNDLLKRKLRLESVPNAIEQGKAVASDIVGKPQPYHQVPWFWSDQYDVKLQIVGVPERVDHKVLRGDDTTNSFAWFYFTDGKLTGVTAVNRMAEFMAGKQLILKACSEGHKISPEQLVDEESKPKSWLA